MKMRLCSTGPHGTQQGKSLRTHQRGAIINKTSSVKATRAAIISPVCGSARATDVYGRCYLLPETGTPRDEGVQLHQESTEGVHCHGSRARHSLRTPASSPDRPTSVRPSIQRGLPPVPLKAERTKGRRRWSRVAGSELRRRTVPWARGTALRTDPSTAEPRRWFTRLRFFQHGGSSSHPPAAREHPCSKPSQAAAERERGMQHKRCCRCRLTPGDQSCRAAERQRRGQSPPRPQREAFVICRQRPG